MSIPMNMERSGKTSGFGRVVVEAAVIAIISALVGVIVNAVRPGGIPFIYQKEQNLQEQVSGIELNDAKALFDSDQALFLDARPADEFQKGHIKGAVSVPVEQYDSIKDSVLAGVSPRKTIVTYCSGEDCMSSVMLANKLADDGHQQIKVFFGGWPKWLAAGYPVEQPWTMR